MRRRSSLRLPEHDYCSPGPYLVTVCTWQRRCLFGVVADVEMRLASFGLVLAECWQELPRHVRGVSTDAFVVMPDHIHGIFWINVGARHASPLHLGVAVGSLKSTAARRINALRGTPGAPVWQRGYHERVIRNDDELRGLRQYVADNPIRWADRHRQPGQDVSR
jgi:REP element-mobilizing transposase RayT